MSDLEKNTSAESLSNSKGFLKLGFKGSTKILGKVISLLGPQAKIPLLIIAAVLIPLLIMVSVLPLGNLFMSQNEVEQTEEKVMSVLESKFEVARKNAKPDIITFVNDKYDLGISSKDLKYKGNGTYQINTNNAYITVSLSPSLSTMKDNISAYINAVNGAIASFGENTKKEADKYKNGEPKEPANRYQGQVLKKDENGSSVLTEDAKKYIEANSNQDTYTANSDYTIKILEDAGSFFTHDTETSRWDLENFKRKPKVHYEEKVNEKTGETEKVKVTEDAWYGHINIAMFYDLSDYRKDELDKVVEIMNEGRNEGDFISGTQLGSILDSYYNNYIAIYKARPDENGETVLGEDNREELFHKLIEDGSLMYVPISGLSENYMSYVAGGKGYSGSLDFKNWDKMSTAQIWAHANKIATQMYPYNCTTFAAAWFYDNYGKNILKGNGRDCVNNLLETEWGSENFYRSATPSPGAIYSIGRAGGGNHVGCVEAVDFEKKTITISDGNTNGAGNSSKPWTATVRIKETMTFAQFNQYVANCCAVHGDYSPRIVFACPNKGAFSNISPSEKE